MRRTRFITIMLFLIVFILVAALLVSVYYVFFSDDSGFLPFFSETKEENTQKEEVMEVTKKYTRKISGTEFNEEVTQMEQWEFQYTQREKLHLKWKIRQNLQVA